MKRDMDLIRQLMLKIEELPESDSDVVADAVSAAERRRDVDYQLRLLTDAGFVRGIAAHSMDGDHWLDLNLTWEGHELLDTIRDPAVWRKTKDGLTKVGGMGLEMMAGVAKAYAKELIKEKLGIDLG